MNNIQNKLIILLFVALVIPHLGSAQDSVTFDLTYDVHKIYPYISVEKRVLDDAETLSDLNEHYKSSWVREYITVEVLTLNNGEIIKAASMNDTLTQKQKNIIGMADLGTDISVKVRYIPENTLTHNDVKEINFTFAFSPESEASYPGGQEELRLYLKENAMNKIADSSFRKFNLTVVRFVIDEEGHIVDPYIYETSKDEYVDELLLETICNMSNWKPAEYSDGTKVRQELVLTVGDMTSCVLGLLNIQKEILAEND